MKHKEHKKCEALDFREKARLHEIEEHKRLNRSGDISDTNLACGGITYAALRKMNFLKPKHKDTWGRWSYNAKNLTLVLDDRKGTIIFKDDNFLYEVDLENCNRAGGALGVLDYIAQIAKKTWADTDIIGNLVFALDDLLNLQDNVIHDKKSRPEFDVKKHLKGVKK